MKARYVAEYVALRLVVGLLNVLPYRGAVFVAWVLAVFSHYAVRYRVAEARRRIGEVFGASLSPREVRRIAWRSWRNFLFCIVDTTRLSRMDRAWLRRHFPGAETAAKAILDHGRTGKGAIFGCPHMGSWEMGGVAMQVLGVPVFFLTGRQKNPLADAYINRLRSASGVATVQKGSSMLRSAVRRLRDGEVLGFLPDVRSATEGIRIRFLGRDANVVAGMALFARMAGVPIFPSILRRTGWVRHELIFGKPVWPQENEEKNRDMQRMTQDVFAVIESYIREAPDQWFWYNKRWILDPFDAPAPVPPVAPPA